jgi:hypothetical protein
MDANYLRRDGEFLTTFDENEEALKDANAAIQEFSSTYLFLKEYTAYAVEKILHIYTQLYQVLCLLIPCGLASIALRYIIANLPPPCPVTEPAAM